jgi:hypothetical protein
MAHNAVQHNRQHSNLEASSKTMFKVPLTQLPPLLLLLLLLLLLFATSPSVAPPVGDPVPYSCCR